MQCRDFREVADSYLGDELLVETNHAVNRHLESCADCRRELAARRDLREQLRRAFINSDELRTSDEFTVRVSARLRSRTAQPTNPIFSRPAWLALAACLLLVGAFGLLALQRRATSQHDESARRGAFNTSDGDESVPPSSDAAAAVRVAMSEVSQSAAGDHRNCAVKFRLPEIPIELERAGLDYDRALVKLDDAVMSGRGTLGNDSFEFVEAHACIFQGRRFGHVVLKYHGRLVSLLLTELDARAGGVLETASAGSESAREVISCSPSDGYQVSCFETERHAVFVVSDLPETDNLRLARALAPAVRAHVVSAESAA